MSWHKQSQNEHTPELITLSAGNLSPLDPYVVMLCKFLDLEFFCYQ